MKTRRLFLIPFIFASAILFIGVFLMVAASPASGRNLPENPDATLLIQVNYARDWVAGYTEIGAPVMITVTDPGGQFKQGAAVTAGGIGDFLTDCQDWYSGACPDIQPGDGVIVTAAGLRREIIPIGPISGKMNELNDTVTVYLPTDLFSGFLNIGCDVGLPGPTITATADLSQGVYVCDYSGEWDILRGDRITVFYDEPDGDQVFNVLEWPWIRANYSDDWVGANYEIGHTVWITVTDAIGSIKATSQVESISRGGWDGPGLTTDQWLPDRPDIIPGDWVVVAADDGYNNTLKVGQIDGHLSVDNDTISGHVLAPWLSPVVTVTVECHPWGAWEQGLGDAPIKQSWAAIDGSQPYSCQWNPLTEWDLVPGQDVAAMYVEPDMDRVIQLVQWPNLGAHIGPWSDGDRHVRGGGAGPGTSVAITVTTDLGEFVAGTAVFADPSGYFDSGNHLPVGSLAPWNQVSVDFGNGLTDTLSVYPLQGLADPNSDVVSISAAGLPTFTIGLEYCYLEQCGWIDLGEIGPDGMVMVDLMAERAFDILPGASFHAHLFTRYRNMVIYSWGLPPETQLFLPVVANP